MPKASCPPYRILEVGRLDLEEEYLAFFPPIGMARNGMEIFFSGFFFDDPRPNLRVLDVYTFGIIIVVILTNFEGVDVV